MQGWMLLFAALAVGVPIVVHLREQRRKALAVALLTNRPLVTGQARFPLVVTYGGTALAQPRLVVFAIGNIGNVAINAEDFVSPLTVAFAAGVVHAADVTRTRPADLGLTVNHSGNAVEVSRCLMNAGDMAEVQCLVDGPASKGDISVHGRVRDVSVLPLLTVPRTSWDEPWRQRVVEDVLTIAGLVGFAAIFVWLAWGETGPTPYVVTGVAILLVALFVRHVLRRGRRSRFFVGS